MKRIAAAPAPRRAPETGSPWMRAVAGVLALSVVFVGVAVAFDRLETFVRSLPAPPTRVEWMDLPAWMTDAAWSPLLQELEDRSGIAPDVDVFDPRVCAYVSDALLSSAWVERVRRVEKRHDGAVRVWADFRRPFAFVQRGSQAHLVDARGVLLPHSMPASAVDGTYWLVLTGVQAAPPTIGQVWPGADLAAGLKLATFLYRASDAARFESRGAIRGVDVSNHNLRRNNRFGELRLVAVSERLTIDWGVPPGDEGTEPNLIEARAARKLAYLEELFARHGGLPDNVRIDLRWEDHPRFEELAPAPTDPARARDG